MFLCPLWFTDAISNSPHAHSQTTTEEQRIKILDVCLANAADDGWRIENLEIQHIQTALKCLRTASCICTGKEQLCPNWCRHIKAHISKQQKIFSVLSFLRSLFAPQHQRSVLSNDLFIDLALLDVIFTWEDIFVSPHLSCNSSAGFANSLAEQEVDRVQRNVHSVKWRSETTLTFHCLKKQSSARSKRLCYELWPECS